MDSSVFLITLITVPTIVAIALLFGKSDMIRDNLVRVAALAIAIMSIVFVVKYFAEDSVMFKLEGEFVSYAMMGIEIILGLLIFYLGVKYKKYLTSFLVVLQVPLMIWFEIKYGSELHAENAFFVDKLSLIMVLIIGIIGSVICVYALGYMKDFAHHHSDQKDRRPFFFFLLFVFLSAMFGIVLCNNIMWMYFFWEITTICSFLLIGYTKTKEATNNSFRAISMNLLGGLAFALAIVYFGITLGILDINQIIQLTIDHYTVAPIAEYAPVIPLALLGLAGMTKAAQMPFSSWLLGAMVAPTPTSALLHSSTMVKAGVFLLVRFAPLYFLTPVAGLLLAIIGGLTFVVCAFLAISQSNAKKLLAYSTVSNLGLIVACAGIGTYEAVWAAILLIIFHAVAKSLLFLSVGTAEHNIGSRDIEDMDGLFSRMPKLAVFMVIGISGMFLAPFGMLLSKWAAMKTFIDYNNVFLIAFLVFGSAATLFFWTKWLGKIVAIMSRREDIESKVSKDEWFAIGFHAVLTVGVCFLFPLISKFVLVPYLDHIYGPGETGIDMGNILIMIAMLGVVVLLLIGAALKKTTNARIVDTYMAGVGTGDNLTYNGSMGKTVNLTLRNWYMEKYFGEKKLALVGVLISTAILVVFFSILMGGLI